MMGDRTGLYIEQILSCQKTIKDNFFEGSALVSADYTNRMKGRYEGLQMALDLINDVLTEKERDMEGLDNE